MYFESDLPSKWDLKQALNEYYTKHNQDYGKALSSMKSDLICLSNKPVVLQSVKNAANSLVKRWSVIIVVISNN